MDGFLPLDVDGLVHLGLDWVVNLGVHVGQETGVHADEGVQVDWEDVAGLDVTQVPLVAPVHVGNKPPRAEIPAGLRAGFDVCVELFQIRTTEGSTRPEILSEVHEKEFNGILVTL